MITLRNKLYESLLDDEDDLVNDDESVKEQLFYDECKLFFPGLPDDNIKRNFTLKNNKIHLKGMLNANIPQRNSADKENCLFRGFSMCPNIDFIGWLSIASDRKEKNKYSINEINKYPMHIKNINILVIWRNDVFDYCPNINIDNINDVTIYNDIDIDINNFDFNFFKCVKNINKITLENSDFIYFKSNPELKIGTIRNIKADKIAIDIKLIKKEAYVSRDIPSDYLNDFLTDIYKNNKINDIFIFTYNKKKNI